jgi:protein TonB
MIYASSGARAIVQPMPQIPDDLREEAFNFIALARFHIAVDGSAKVELAKPTPNPRLNWILLDSLKKWRFIPAIKNGKPVASTEEIVVKIEVK